MKEKEVDVFTSGVKMANYVNNFYKRKNNTSEDISDIVLQKSLYFLFAYWGGFIRQGKIDNNIDVSSQPEYLYSDRIEAWTYGPVLPEIYKLRKQGKLFVDGKYDDLFKNNNFMENIIDGLLNDILEVDAFRLVTISHMDKCWQDNYVVEDEKHNREIDKELILEEYGNKVKI